MMGMSTVMTWFIPSQSRSPRLTGHQDVSTSHNQSDVFKNVYRSSDHLLACALLLVEVGELSADQEKLTHVKEVFMEKENALTSKAGTREP